MISLKNGILLNGHNSLKSHFLLSLDRILHFESVAYGGKKVNILNTLALLFSIKTLYSHNS